MMKKFLLLSALIAIGASCKDDEDPTLPSYPTDGLTLQNKYNALLMMGSDIQNPSTAIYEISRLQALDEYPGRLNTLNMVSTPVGPLYDTDGDSIMMNFQSPAPPYFVLDDMNISPTELFQNTKYSIREKPLVSVTHKVSQNDTSWIIDHKVQFWMDTNTAEIYIDTYMLGKIKARQYTTSTPALMDLRMAATQKLINNPGTPVPNESQWDLDVVNADTSKVLESKGSPFYYENVFLAKFDSTGTWGYPLGDYWPFNNEFYNGDIIGTKDTPIRHYFQKFTSQNADSEDLVANTEISFMSIVWVRDMSTGSFVHANSFISTSTFKVK